MSNEAQIKSVALFFSFALMDDQLARQATLATLYRLKKKLEKEKLNDIETQSLIVELMMKFWLRYQKYIPKSGGMYSGGLNTLKNDYTDLGPWREFKRMTDDNEFLAVLWSQVIGFSDEAIAKGLNTTIGTVRHRVSRGLRLLGERMI
ncbi:MAG: hypothetical protein KDD58_10020 [Bdellovibrionales bacterium]|nr:hypothetical protein [Bdellovibrionales bacterium]